MSSCEELFDLLADLPIVAQSGLGDVVLEVFQFEIVVGTCAVDVYGVGEENRSMFICFFI